MSPRLPLFALLASLVLHAHATAAFITLDNFSNPDPGTFFRVNPPGQQVNPLTISTSTGFGSTRNATFQVDFPNPLPAGANALTGTIGFESGLNDGVLDFNSNTFAQARAILNYNALSGSSANFYQGGDPTYLYFNFLSLDPGIDLSTNSPAANMPVDIAISTTGGTLTGSFLFAQTPNPVQYQIPFAALAGTGDLSQVTSYTFTFNGGPNQRQRADFVVSAITLETVPVPVPPTAFVALLGVPTLALVRRCRKSAVSLA